MLVLRFLRWMFGYVVFLTKGNNPERILNCAVRDGIHLWNVKGRCGTLTACIAKSQYKRLRPFARQLRLRLRICEKHGFPFIVHKYRRRTGVLAGMAVFAAVIYLLSMYVWDVQINGNVQLTTEQVEQVMSELGIAPGTLKNKINAGAMEQSVMVRLPDISWISINMQGSEIKVELRERVVPPKIIPENQPCNLKASLAGQIIRLEVYRGTATVKNGDAVTPGKMLINGIIEDKYGNNTLKHAAGRAIAATKHTLEVQVPLEQQIITPTQHTISRKRLWIFGIEIPVSFAQMPEGNYTREFLRQPVTIGEVNLPIKLFTEKWTEQQTNTVTISEEQAAAQAEEMLLNKEQTELAQAKIVQKQTNTRLENGVYYLVANYNCEEDIAVESEIIVNPS